MVYNYTTVTFAAWYKELIIVAEQEYDVEITNVFHEKYFEKQYQVGMDIHEAIQTYLDEK